MARINFEDDVESRDEFRKLVKLLGGDDDRARGMLIRFWRIAQKHWAEYRLVSDLEMESGEVQVLIDSRWALHYPDGYTEEDGTKSLTTGYYAIGSEERFAWYRQKVQAGIKRASAKRDGNGQFTSGSPAAHDSAGAAHQRLTEPHQPPSPSPVPAPAPAQKQNTTTTASQSPLLSQVREAWSHWEETLRAFKIEPRAMNLPQQSSIARAITTLGFENVCDALKGARYDEADLKSGYDPKKHLSLDRVLHKNAKTGVSNWERLANLTRSKSPKSNQPKSDLEAWEKEMAELRRKAIQGEEEE